MTLSIDSGPIEGLVRPVNVFLPIATISLLSFIVLFMVFQLFLVGALIERSLWFG